MTVRLGAALVAIATVVCPAQATSVQPEAVTLNGVLNPETDDTPVFSPDGRIALFDRQIGDAKTVMTSRRMGKRWGPAVAAPFSGTWFDQNPAFAPDGSYLLFDSNRPTSPGAQPLTQSFFRKPGPGSNIWRVDIKRGVFGQPRWLGLPVNDSAFVDFPAIAGDGSLYYLKVEDRRVLLFRSQLHHGRYGAGVKVEMGGVVNTVHDVAVDPKETVMFFDYGRTPTGLGRFCVALREGQSWGAPIDLGDAVNQDDPWGARLSPAGDHVYFTTNKAILRVAVNRPKHDWGSQPCKGPLDTKR